MAPDAVRVADLQLLRAGTRPEVRGGTAIAEETRHFLDRIAAAEPVHIAGRPGAIVAPGGHPYALIHFRVSARLVTRIEITAYAAGAVTLTDRTCEE